MLPPEARLPDLATFVEQQLYFVLHAARQTGKTTAMQAAAERLRGLGSAAVWATLETTQGIEDIERAEPLWIESLASSARWRLPAHQQPPPTETFVNGAPGRRFGGFIQAWCAQMPTTPMVLLLDEADIVTGPALVSLLRQLRSGFSDRGPGRFPVCVALIGMRDLRDYLTAAKDGSHVNPGSPFNVKSDSLTLRNFTRPEVAALYAQHTADTGQIFNEGALFRAWDWTRGQPFLVNALARIAIRDLAPNPSTEITAEIFEAAKEQLILSRTTHLDSLSVRLLDARVARVIEKILVGDEGIAYDHDDFQFVVDLGLVVRAPNGAEIANPLYREVLARQLSYNTQANLHFGTRKWERPDGTLDFPALIESFRVWWRENTDVAAEVVPQGYHEALAQIAFMGYLHRVVNGGGRIFREYSAGRRAIDILVEYGPDRHVVELKRVRARDGLDRIKADGIEQLSNYLDSLDLTEGWLLIFDRRNTRTWRQRLWSKEVVVNGKTIHLRGA